MKGTTAQTQRGRLLPQQNADHKKTSTSPGSEMPEMGWTEGHAPYFLLIQSVGSPDEAPSPPSASLSRSATLSRIACLKTGFER